MSMSPAEAATALREVDETTARTVAMKGYRHVSPHLLLWGAIWVIGYVLMGLEPRQQWGWVWLPLDLLGMVGSAILGSLARAAARSGRGSTDLPPGPLLVSLLFVGLFMAAVYIVFAPTATEPYLVLPPLVLGLVYVVAGAWRMQRLAWIGAAVFLLTMVGFLFFKPWLSFWIAAVGGGGLVLGGLWLRKI
jgi:hypothetical protein